MPGLKTIFGFAAKHLYLSLFLLVFILFAISISRDIGVAWDELEVYSRGRFLIDYLLGKATYDEYLLDSYGLFYNHFYSAVLNILNFRDTYGMFHLLNSVFTLPLFIAIYILLYVRYKKSSLSVVGPFLLLLTANFSGHLPINPKDVPFATFYFLAVAAIYFSHKLKDRQLAVLLMGSFFGIAISLRILGISLFVVYLVYSFYKRKRLLDTAQEFLLVFIASSFFLVATWPYLGSNFVSNFIEMVRVSKEYAWAWQVLFMGQNISALELSRNYLPVWFLVTTPLFILIPFLLFVLNHDRG